MKRIILCIAFAMLFVQYGYSQLDAALTSIDYPETQCVMTNAEPIIVSFTNTGVDTIFNAQLCFIADVNPQVCDPWTGVLPPGESAQHTFSATADLSAVAAHFLFVHVNLAGDVNPTNDSLWAQQKVHLITHSTGPSFEDFEVLGDGDVGNFVNAWVGDPSSGFHWESLSGGTPTNNTGPSGDHSSPGNQYMYTEANGSNSGDVAILYSTCNDLTALFNPVMDFWYHKYGSVAQMGDMYVDVWTHSTKWVTKDSIMSTTHSSEGEAWKLRGVPLASGPGDIMRLRFRAMTPGGSLGDMAIDDMELREAYTNDAELIEVLEPNGGCDLSATENVSVRITNRGTGILGGFNVTYDFGTPVTEAYPGVLFPGDTGIMTFATPADLSSPALYSFDFYLDADQNADNDSIFNHKVTSSPLLVAPFVEDFETAIDGETGAMSNLWTGDPTGSGDYYWEANSGGTPSGGSGTGPLGDNTTGSGIYAYTEASASGNGDVAYLTSPCIDLSGLVAPILEFYYHKHGAAMGDLYIDLLDTTGWLNGIDAVLGETHASRGQGWTKRSLDLSNWAGQEITLRFRGVSGGDFSSDMSIDDVGIHDPYFTDAEIVSANIPSTNCGLSATETVSAAITNVGIDTLTNISLSYDFTGTPVVEVIAGPLVPGDTIFHVFATTANLSTPATYSFDFFVGAVGDLNPLNDSILDLVVTNSAFVPTPHTEDFESLNPGATADDDDGESGIMSNGWEANPTTAGNYYWSAETGFTQTGSGGWGTGPEYDHTTGSGNYMYVEATNGNGGDVANLTTPCLSLAALTTPTLEFWYHRFGTSLGDMHLDVYDGNTWTNGVFTQSGQTHNANNDQWDLALVDLGAFVGQNVTLRFRADYGGNWSGDMAIDDINIRDGYQEDLQLMAVLAPLTGCGLDSMEDVTIQIRNIGIDPIVNYDVAYNLTGTPVVETITDTIFPGDTLTYTFTQTADLDTVGLYTFDIYTALGTDAFKANDSILNIEVSNSNTLYFGAFLEDFESIADGETGVLSNGWEGDPASGFAWEANSGGTPSNNTGPNMDHTTGTGIYMYTEASGGGLGDQAYLISPCIDASSLVSPQLDYWYHKRGNRMGAMRVDMWTPTTGWVNSLDYIGGSTHGSSNDPYLMRTVDLTAAGGQLMKVRFWGDNITSGFNKRGDMAIDDINLRERDAFDAEAIALETPADACGMTNAEVVSIKVTNKGLTSIPNLPVSYQFGGSIVTETLPDTIHLGDTVTYAFATTVDLSIADSSYVFKLWTGLAGDLDLSNDTLFNVSVFHTPTITIPFCEDLESLFDTPNTNSQGDKGSFNNSWVASPTSGYAWEANTGETWSGCCSGGTNNVGPLGDHTTGTGMYLHVEASGPAGNGDVAELLSPCLMLDTLIEPAFGWWYHMFGEDMGSLYLDVFDGTTWTNDIGGSTHGEIQTAKADPWLMSEADLSPWYGQRIQLRLRAIHVGGPYGDISIDDFCVFEGANFLDAMTIEGIVPESACGLSNAETISVKITNQGLQRITGFDINYDFIGAPVTETYNDTLDYLDTVIYTFVTPADLSAPGQYSFDFWTELAGDQDLANDAQNGFDLTNYPTLMGPTVEDFESIGDGQTGLLSNFWEGGPDGSSNYYWETNTGPTLTINTGPSGDHTTGSGNYVFTEATAASNGTMASVTSPCIDLSAMANPMFDFWYHKYGSILMGDMYIDIHDGTSWNNNIDSIPGQVQTSGSDPWLLETIDLESWAGQTIKLRFRAISNGPGQGDMAIDDINIREKHFDIATISASVPSSACGLSAAEQVEIEVVNLGEDTLTSFDISYDFTGTPVTESINAILLPGDTATYVFTATADLSAAAKYTFDFWAQVMGDTTLSNDSILAMETANFPTMAVPYLEDFDNTVDGETGVLTNLWEGDPNGTGNYFWEANNGGTPTSNTGPDQDHTSGTGNYAYTEADLATNGEIANLTSHCFDLGSLIQPTLKFWYHKFGSAAMGDLYVDLHDGTSWNMNIDSVIGSTHGSNAAAWDSLQTDLTSWASQTIRLRLRGVANGASLGDMAIDDVYLFDTYTGDVGVTEGIIPNDGCGLSSTEPITVRIENYGLTAMSNFNVAYDFTGTPVVETVAGPLAAGASTTYTFATTADLSATGLYYFDFWTDFTDDLDRNNDSLLGMQVSNYATYIAPYIENFDALADGDKGWMSNNWTGSPTTEFHWEANVGPTPGFGTGPDGDHTGDSSAYMYTDAGTSVPGTFAELLTPCIDLDSLADPVCNFWYHKHGSAMQDLYVDVYANGVWTNGIDTIVGRTHYGSFEPWTEHNTFLSAFRGEIIQIRFRAPSSDDWRNEMGLDDVRIWSYDPTSITEHNTELGFQLAPNPTSGQVMVHGIDGAVNIVVMDVSGRPVLTTTDIRFNISAEPPGVYIVRISQDSRMGIKRIVKR